MTENEQLSLSLPGAICRQLSADPNAFVHVQLSFLPSTEGTLHQPAQLYDPEDDELRLLLPESVFPSHVYCSNPKVSAHAKLL